MKKLFNTRLFLLSLPVLFLCVGCSKEPASGSETLSPALDKFTAEDIFREDEANRIERKDLEELHTGASREDMIRCLGLPNRWDGELVANYYCTNGEYVHIVFGWKVSDDGEDYEYEVEEIAVWMEESSSGGNGLAPTTSVSYEEDIFRTDKANRIERKDITEIRIGDKQEEVVRRLGFPNEGRNRGSFLSQYHCADGEYVVIRYRRQKVGEWEGYAVASISLRNQPYELKLSMTEEPPQPVDEENRIRRENAAELHTGATQDEVFGKLGFPNRWIYEDTVEYLCTNGERVEIWFRWKISEDWEGYRMTSLFIGAQPPENDGLFPTPDIGSAPGTLTTEEMLREDKANRVEWENAEEIRIGTTQAAVIRLLGFPNNAEENCAQYYTADGEYIMIYYWQRQIGEWKGNVVSEMILASRPYLVK